MRLFLPFFYRQGLSFDPRKPAQLLIFCRCRSLIANSSIDYLVFLWNFINIVFEKVIFHNFGIGIQKKQIWIFSFRGEQVSNGTSTYIFLQNAKRGVGQVVYFFDFTNRNTGAIVINGYFKIYL